MIQRTEGNLCYQPFYDVQTFLSDEAAHKSTTLCPGAIPSTSRTRFRCSSVPALKRAESIPLNISVECGSACLPKNLRTLALMNTLCAASGTTDDREVVHPLRKAR